MPASVRRIRRALRRLGIKLVERPGKGSHVVVDDGRGHCYILPAHHGDRTELSDVYVRGLCRALRIDYDELRQLL